MAHTFIKTTIPLLCAALLSAPAFGQAKFGVGAKVSTLGYGFEAATFVTEQSNVRAGFNFLGYNRNFSRNGFDYDAHLRARSVEAHYDWFLGSGFHVSPGILLYNGDQIEGAANVPSGKSFKLGDRTYTSGPSPVKGTVTAELGKSKVAPMITAGFGNLLRTGHRWSVNVEGGFAFKGSPKADLNLTGTACSTGAVVNPCFDVNSNSQIQGDIAAEENKVNTGATPYDTLRKITRFYPVISVGFSYRIK